MDALELLKIDHDKVKFLFKQVGTASSVKEKRGLFNRIFDELTVHSHIEKTVLYPAFTKYPEFKNIIDRSYYEHQQADNLLMEIEKLDQQSPELSSKLDQLIQSVTQHVEEEENELFPMIRKTMRRPEREALGRHLQAAKSEQAAA